jgi:hypothetical protein
VQTFPVKEDIDFTSLEQQLQDLIESEEFMVEMGSRGAQPQPAPEDPEDAGKSWYEKDFIKGIPYNTKDLAIDAGLTGIGAALQVVPGADIPGAAALATGGGRLASFANKAYKAYQGAKTVAPRVATALTNADKAAQTGITATKAMPAAIGGTAAFNKAFDESSAQKENLELNRLTALANYKVGNK